MLLSKLVDKLEQSKDFSADNLETIIRNLRHVLVLATDRLDYETLHLVWLPQLDRVSNILPNESLEVQALCHLFSLFMVQREDESILPSGNALYKRAAELKRLEQMRLNKFT